MKTVKIKINGTEHTLCYSVRVVRAAVERFGTLEAMSEVLFGGNSPESIDARLWLLAQEMEAGARYAARCGENAPEPLSVEEIMDTVPGMQFGDILTEAINAVVEGSSTSIDAEAPAGKNAEATPEE